MNNILKYFEILKFEMKFTIMLTLSYFYRLSSSRSISLTEFAITGELKMLFSSHLHLASNAAAFSLASCSSSSNSFRHLHDNYSDISFRSNRNTNQLNLHYIYIYIGLVLKISCSVIKGIQPLFEALLPLIMMGMGQ